MIWLVGAGNMAKDYANVLKEMNIEFKVIGRGEKSAKDFKDSTGIDVITGGLRNQLNSKEKPTHIILATPVNELSSTLLESLDAGIKNILVEKPGFLFISEGSKALKIAQEKQCHVFVAYNRRFFSSVLRMTDLIQEDNGLESFHFEFTEWSDSIEKLPSAAITLERWVLSNSTHVIDLAFHLGSSPSSMTSQTSGKLTWHPTSSYFAGMGKTRKEIPFTYFASWDAPGRWGLEFLTKKRRFVLRPMEKLQVQNRNSVKIEDVALQSDDDIKFKPGLKLMTEAFLNPQHSLRKNLCTLEEQVENFSAYCKIANYEI